MTTSISRHECPGNGVRARDLEGVGWTRVTHGRYVPAGSPDDLAATLEAIAPVLPAGAGWSHITAARLYGLWLPTLPSWISQTATLPPLALRPERSGLYVARSRAALPSPWTIHGVQVLAPELVVAQLAEDLEVLDLVAALDCALYLRLCSIESILAGLRARQRGLPRLRRALALCDGRSESPWETFHRVLHVVSEIPVEPQAPILDAQENVVARADLRIVGTRRLPEYDGANHRDRHRHQRDLAREKQLHRLGFERYGYTARELVQTPDQIIRDAETAAGLRHDPTRINAWLELFERSTLSIEGRRRLVSRLRRFSQPLRGRVSRR